MFWILSKTKKAEPGVINEKQLSCRRKLHKDARQHFTSVSEPPSRGTYPWNQGSTEQVARRGAESGSGRMALVSFPVLREVYMYD
ncbi:unnamed protein product [Thelazia callipaeda]|uniref:Uncharacterized protein n=1 Tax=Thelazia callipaeda TaxID=103827 RepID=A0A0N5D6G3_THECL|nr:unnamed protein product [Thelazia callipaeda]